MNRENISGSLQTMIDLIQHPGHSHIKDELINLKVDLNQAEDPKELLRILEKLDAQCHPRALQDITVDSPHTPWIELVRYLRSQVNKLQKKIGAVAKT